MVNKMSGNVNFRKDKIKSMIENGYKVKVGKKSYIFFKDKEYYLDLYYLEKLYSEYYNEINSMEVDGIIDNGYDLDNIIFLISMIEKFIKTFSLNKIVIYYDDDSGMGENPFLIKFPNIGHLDLHLGVIKGSEEIDEKLKILEKVFYIKNKDLWKKYENSISLLEEKIKVKYIVKNERFLNHILKITTTTLLPENIHNVLKEKYIYN